MDKQELAVRAWPILVEYAKSEESLSYANLAQKLGSRAIAMKWPLSVIQDFCRDHGLPPLTALVHQKGSNKVGQGFNAVEPGEIEAATREVRKYPWNPQPPLALAAAASRYWVFVCNPKKWAVDRFLASGQREDSWGVRKSDSSWFAPGQLGIVRVGADSRSRTELAGRPRLASGIYAICQVESASYPATGAGDLFWEAGSSREPGWPTVKLRYLRTFLNEPLTIATLRSSGRPSLSKLLLDGFQGASFPISEADFRTVIELLDLDIDELGEPINERATSDADISRALNKYKDAAPSVKERLSRFVERGSVGQEVKVANGHRCQICDALGRPAIGFHKLDGTPYVEAHHVVQVSTLRPGALAHENVVTVCPNHHRELHFGGCTVEDQEAAFAFNLAGGRAVVKKFQR